MRPNRISAPWLALALASCAGPAAEPIPGEPPGETLTLAFAWPRDLAAEVEVKRTRAREDERGSGSHVVEARYRLRTEPQPDSLRIVSEDLRVTRIDGRPLSGIPPGRIERAESTVVTLAPTLRVDAEGRVLEVEGLEALRRETAARIAADVPQAAAQARWIAEKTLTPEGLSESWSAAVRFWVGLEVGLGAEYDMVRGDGPPDTLEVSERIACFPGDAERRCIRLRFESRLENAASDAELRSATRELSSRLGAEALPADVALSVEVREEIELVTEPERLIPHFVRKRLERRIHGEHASEARSSSRIEESELRYRY